MANPPKSAVEQQQVRWCLICYTTNKEDFDKNVNKLTLDTLQKFCQEFLLLNQSSLRKSLSVCSECLSNISTVLDTNGRMKKVESHVLELQRKILRELEEVQIYTDLLTVQVKKIEDCLRHPVEEERILYNTAEVAANAARIRKAILEASRDLSKFRSGLTKKRKPNLRQQSSSSATKSSVSNRVSFANECQDNEADGDDPSSVTQNMDNNFTGANHTIVKLEVDYDVDYDDYVMPPSPCPPTTSGTEENWAELQGQRLPSKRRSSSRKTVPSAKKRALDDSAGETMAGYENDSENGILLDLGGEGTYYTGFSSSSEEDYSDSGSKKASRKASRKSSAEKKQSNCGRIVKKQINVEGLSPRKISMLNVLYNSELPPTQEMLDKFKKDIQLSQTPSTFGCLSPQYYLDKLERDRICIMIQYDEEREFLHVNGVEIKILEEDTSVQCSSCDYTLKVKIPFDKEVRRAIKNHILGNHCDFFKCPICALKFRTVKKYISHLKNHREINPFSCDICGKPGSSSKSMKGHIWTHKNEYEQATAILRGEMPTQSEDEESQNDNSIEYRHHYCNRCMQFVEQSSIPWHNSKKCVYYRQSRPATSPRPRPGSNKSKVKEHQPELCPICGLLLKTRKIMLRHVRNKHPSL